jgi:hypothetical protein
MTVSGVLDRSGGSASYSIPDLVQQASKGRMRVPTFQRQFVWTAANVRDLFDSIYRGFPVGTLLLWQHEAPAGEVTLGPIRLAVPQDPGALWVVDGQQRITSLFAALNPDPREADERFEVYFDLATEKFVNPRRGAVTPRSIPVRQALETRSLLNWLRQREGELEPADLDRADRLGGSLRDYRIPAYIVSGDDQTLLREVFDRVNSAGKPISRAQVFHALFGNDEEPGSPSSVLRALRPLRFGDIGESRVVQSVLAVRGGDIQRDIHGEFDTDEDPADWYDNAEQALTRSISFLRSEGVPHVLMMPNTTPIPVLAAFFHVHSDPEPWTLRLLSRWLWRGWVHGFGHEDGQTPVLRRAVRSVNPVHRDRDRAPSEFDAVRDLLRYTPDRETPTLQPTRFNTKSASSRLILLAMAALGPRRVNGDLVDLAAEFEEHGTKAVTELVRGHRSEAAALGFWPRDEGAIAKVGDEAVLHSHLIDATAARSLRSGDVSGFLGSRGAEIGRLTTRFLEARLEKGALIRPSLSELALLGAAAGDA